MLLAFALPTGAAGADARHPADPHGIEEGIASYYAPELRGRPTASGAAYDEHAYTAAHRTLPFGTRVRVTNLANGRHVVVTITDRGPAPRDRIIDVSRRVAYALGFERAGTTRVRLKVLPP
jgi:rare lipoprotein A